MRREVIVTGRSATPWASVTFAGARHRVTVAGACGHAVDVWLAGLAEAELPIAGHLIADTVVAARRDAGERFEAEIELLSVEER